MRFLWDEQTNVVLRDTFEPLVPVLELVTHLGDGTFLVAIAILLYWFGRRPNRRERAFVIAVGVAALALSAGIKGMFGLPRPTLPFSPAYYPGYTFPSAHAMGSAAFYLALAVTMKTGRRSVRIAIAVIIVAIVSLSRVVLGVHYAGDVVVGAGLGALIVWIGLQWRWEGNFHPIPILILAAVIAAGTAFLGATEYVALSFGAATGGAIGWFLAVPRSSSDSGAAILVLGGFGLAGMFVIRITVGMIGPPEPGPSGMLSLIAETLGYLILTVFVFLVPALATRIEDYPAIQTLQDQFPFRGRHVVLDDELSRF